MSEEKTEEGQTYRVDITVYIDAPTDERVSEIVDILETKLLEVPGIHRFDVE